MEEKILDDEELELLGLKRKILPEGEEQDEIAPQPEEEVPLYASLDQGYGYDGYAEEEPTIDFSNVEEDDESLVMLSPEEAIETLHKRAEEERKKQEEFEALIAAGEQALEAKDFAGARRKFKEANEVAHEDLRVNVGYMRAHSEDFTALENFAHIQEVYVHCYESAGEAFAAKIKEQFGGHMQAAITAAKKEEAILAPEVLAGQKQRREMYRAQREKDQGVLFKLLLVLAVCVIATAVSVYFINAIKGPWLLISSIVFGVLSAGLAVVCFVLGKKVMGVFHLERANEKLSSTKEGRRLEYLREKIEFLKECLK